MHRFIGLLVIMALLIGCQDTVRQASSPSFSDNPQANDNPAQPVQDIKTPSYVTLDYIQVNDSLHATEEGYAIFVHVTSTMNRSIGATIRYPEKNVVLSFDNVDCHCHALKPLIQIPNEDGVNVEVAVMAVPNDISSEGLDILGYAFTTIVTSVIPGAKVGEDLATKIMKYAGQYLLGKAADQAFTAIAGSRLVGYTMVPVRDIVAHQEIQAAGFLVKATASSAPLPDVAAPLPPQPAPLAPTPASVYIPMQVQSPTDPDLTLTGLATSSEATTLTFFYHASKKIPVQVAPAGANDAIYLIDSEHQRQYRLTSVVGIALEPEWTRLEAGSELRFTLTFEPLADETRTFDLFEGGDRDPSGKVKYWDIPNIQRQ